MLKTADLVKMYNNLEANADRFHEKYKQTNDRAYRNLRDMNRLECQAISTAINRRARMYANELSQTDIR